MKTNNTAVYVHQLLMYTSVFTVYDSLQLYQHRGSRLLHFIRSQIFLLPGSIIYFSHLILLLLFFYHIIFQTIRIDPPFNVKTS